jgi:hypothetical protein
MKDCMIWLDKGLWCCLSCAVRPQWLMLWLLSRRGEMRRYSHAWVRYGELWEDFRPRLYWWGSIKELRKLGLILVLVLLQVGLGRGGCACWQLAFGAGVS